MAPVPPDVTEFRERFGVDISTSFGMTEISTPFGGGAFTVTKSKSCGHLLPGYPAS
jgi:acyl-coenzyme A synthetase/AMP-(fatty) acid ligase